MSRRPYNSITLGVQSASLFVFLHCVARDHLYLKKECEEFYFDIYDFLQSLKSQKESNQKIFFLTVLRYPVLHCAMLCCAMLCGTMLCCAMLCCAMLCYATLCCTTLCCPILCCAMLCCAAL